MPAKKSANETAARPARAAGKKTAKKVAPSIARRAVKKPGSVPSKIDAPRLSRENKLGTGVGPATFRGPDPKADRARDQIKRIGGIDSQRVEERHRMTRHKKNQ